MSSSHQNSDESSQSSSTTKDVHGNAGISFLGIGVGGGYSYQNQHGSSHSQMDSQSQENVIFIKKILIFSNPGINFSQTAKQITMKILIQTPIQMIIPTVIPLIRKIQGIDKIKIQQQLIKELTRAAQHKKVIVSIKL